MFTDFQNSFTVRVSSKFAIIMLKHSTTPESCRYITLWNIYVQKIATRKECLVRLSHSKIFKIFVCWNKKYLVPNRKMFTAAKFKIAWATLHNYCNKEKRCRSKMPYMTSSWSVTDGISLSVSKSKLVYSSLISLDNKVKWICLLS